VENMEGILAEEGLPPREARGKSMRQIQNALIGIRLVLSAVGDHLQGYRRRRLKNTRRSWGAVIP
jgi:hypothetical protein